MSYRRVPNLASRGRLTTIAKASCVPLIFYKAEAFFWGAGYA